MAVKYAVASGAWSSTSIWSDTDGGSGGASLPAAGDAVYISAGVNVLMDVDLSATQLGNVCVRGGDVPGMLYFKDGTSGYLNCATLMGSSGTYKGRVLANSSGTWDDTTPLGITYQAIIVTNSITGTYLEMRLYCTQPQKRFIRACGSKVIVTASVENSAFSCTSHGLTDGDYVAFAVFGSDTLPAPLRDDCMYQVVNADENTFQVANRDSTPRPIPLTSAGSGTIIVYTGSLLGDTHNVLEDVTSDPAWSQGSAVNVSSPGSTAYSTNSKYNTSLLTIGAQSVTLAHSIQAANIPPALITLTSRNVAIRFNTSSSTSLISNLKDSVLQCELRNTYSTGTSSGGRCFASQNSNIDMLGVMSGFESAIYSGSQSINVQGVIAGCRFGKYSGVMNCPLGCLVIGCNYAILNASGKDIHSQYGTIRNCAYGYGGTLEAVDFNGELIGCGFGIDGASGGTISGVIAGCSTGLRNCTEMDVDADIVFCGYDSLNGAIINHSFGTISGTVRHCSRGVEIANGVFSGLIDNCSKVGLALTDSVLSADGVVKNCYGGVSLAGTKNWIFGEVSGCDKDFAISGTAVTMARNALIPTSPTFITRLGPACLRCENIGRIAGAHKTIFGTGDMTKAACDGTGTAPSTGPKGRSGDCVACRNMTAFVGSYPIPIFDELLVWLSAGSHTITVPIQTTYTGIAQGGMTLNVSYIGTGNKIAEASSDAAIAQRANAADWSQGLSVTITTTQDGWARLSLSLSACEEGGEVFVWPVPEVG